MIGPDPDWYKPIAAHLRSAYLRYSFTMGSVQEVDFLMDELRLERGMRLLDVGMGPGRHAVEFAARGLQVVGIDLSSEFVDLARARASTTQGVQASFFAMDARHMPFEDEFDGVISICEGAFSLGIDDLGILRRMAAALKPGARLAVGAVNVFYVTRHHSEGFDPATMLFKETQEVIGEDGSRIAFEMWNSCFTSREMEWIANGAALEPLAVYGIEPGKYARSAPGFDHPELLLVAEKPKPSNELAS